MIYQSYQSQKRIDVKIVTINLKRLGKIFDMVHNLKKKKKTYKIHHGQLKIFQHAVTKKKKKSSNNGLLTGLLKLTWYVASEKSILHLLANWVNVKANVLNVCVHVSSIVRACGVLYVIVISCSTVPATMCWLCVHVSSICTCLWCILRACDIMFHSPYNHPSGSVMDWRYYGEYDKQKRLFAFTYFVDYRDFYITA